MKDASPAAARRYARALLDVALKDGSAEKVREELRSALRLLREQKELLSALLHPAIPVERKKNIVAAVWSTANASNLFGRLMNLLVEYDRVGLLASIEESFTAQWNENRKVIAADVVSAVALDPSQTEAIAKVVGSVAGRTVELRTMTDPALLGGILVRVGGLSYDGTVRARLAALRGRLAGA
jgi:F-type H+-transporting ATPase subunit delta